MKRTMGIIGFGRFGRFAAFQLRDHFDLSVFDSGFGMEEARSMGFRTGSLEEVAKSSIVLLCVPISRIRSVLLELVPYLTGPSLVVDTCSVKEYPVSQMETILPPHVEILGTHPLFGPDSAAQGVQGKKIVLCPVRIQNLSGVERFLNGLGLNILVCSPEAHDRAMASTQVIVQFLGRAFLDMGLTRQEIATPGYDVLIDILKVVQSDTRQLFCDLQTFNRFAKEMREKLVASLLKVNQNLE